jgi:spiro-SPASM protein
MKTLCAVLNRPVVQPDRLLQNRTVAQWIEDALNASLEGVTRVFLGPYNSAAELVEGLAAASEGYDETVLVWNDAPFLRADVMTEMLALHRKYRADYTFADGFPVGLTPEILKPALLSVLREWAKNSALSVDRGTLFELLSTDINRFDVETHLSPVDLRSRRLSLTADSLRNRLLLDRYAEDAGLEIRAFLDVLESTGTRARTLPATLHVQVTDGAMQVPVWSPVQQFLPQTLTSRNSIGREQWNGLLDQALAWAGDLTVLPSFWGEPSLHPEILGLLTDALGKPGLRLCVETSGLGWTAVDLEALAKHPGAGRIDWIVELDSDVAETYRTMRGDGFDEAHAFVSRLLPLFPGRVWPQTVRMGLNESEMEAFYKRWKNEAGRVIIQKHNDFGGRLEKAKPSDLSPWKRHACWHLARDLAVFLDGTVVVCRDDFSRTMPLGHVGTDTFETIWERGAALFDRHVREDWPEVCQNCDEWYTFHF